MDIFIEWVIPIISGAILFELANKFYFKGDREKIKKESNHYWYYNNTITWGYYHIVNSYYDIKESECI